MDSVYNLPPHTPDCINTNGSCNGYGEPFKEKGIHVLMVSHHQLPRNHQCF